MDFKEATTRLGELGLTHEEIGDALGLAAATIRAARLNPDSPSYRRPPEDWRPKLQELARGRGGSFEELAEELEDSGA